METNNEITLVTAFFNIGRENFKAIPREDSKYFNEFEQWARLQNKLIVYTHPQMKQRVLDIRRKFGLEQKTIVITIENIFEIESEIFNRMKVVSESKWFKDFRILPNATSNIPEYSYLMLLKTYFLNDAVGRNLTSAQVAWIDFGFNHGSDLYLNPEEFSFEWKYSFSHHIQYFYYLKYDEKPIFEIVRRLCDCIMGCLIVAPSDLCSELWNLNRNAMITLLDMGLIDDDQLIHMMSYRKKPELFKLSKSKWFLPLKEYGGDNLITLRDENIESRLKKFARHTKREFLKRKRALISAKKLYVNLVKDE